MSKAIITCVDAGNMNLNVYSEGMSDPLVITNALANVTPSSGSKRTKMYFSKNIAEDPRNCLDVSIISNGTDLGRKYVGGLALKNNGKLRPLDRTKYNDEDVLYSILTGIAATQVKAGENKTVKVRLGTCIPAREFTNDDNIKRHEKRLIGTHVVTFNHDIFENAVVTIQIFEGEVLTIAEGVASMANICTDEKGALKKEYEDLEDRIIILADIGGGTLDIVGMINYEIIGNLLSFAQRGISYAEENIMRAIKDIRPDFVTTRAKLDMDIRLRDCKMIDGEGTWDIKEIVQAELKEESEKIAQHINDLIASVPDNYRNNISRVVLTGGSVHLLSEYLTDSLKNFKVLISPNCLNDNVMGTYKALKAHFYEKNRADTELMDTIQEAK